MEKALEILKADLSGELYYVALHGICETSRAKMLREAIAELEEAMKPKTCEGYKEDEEDWRGQCGCIWGFNGENPTMAEAYFCPQCGGKILVPHKKKKGYNVY